MQNSGFPGWFIALFVLFLAIGIGSGIARFAYRRSKGVNPVFAREQLEAKIINSPALTPDRATQAPGKTIEERLAELEDLHARGIITDAELAEARSKAIFGD